MVRGVTEGVSMVTNKAIFQINTVWQEKPLVLLKCKHGHKAFLQTGFKLYFRKSHLYHIVMITINPLMTIKISKRIN